MTLWIQWYGIISQLRPVFTRTRTFLWFMAATAAISIRTDLAGVTSLVRALGLQEKYYDRLLDFFHSKSICSDRLAKAWTALVLKVLARFLLVINEHIVLVADGIKAPKTGKKMPAVKKLHQESQNNTKPEYIFGHSCQAVAVVINAAASYFALPLACRIHEGVVFSNRDKRSLLDKLIILIDSLGLSLPFYMVADAYYASAKIILPLLKKGHHLISSARSTAVAYEPATQSAKPRRGRRKLYGKKIRLKDKFNDISAFQQIPSPVYGERGITLRYLSLDLLWRPIGRVVRFVLVIHPTRGNKILFCTDTSLDPAQIIELYGIRFKIEVSFKQSVHTIGAYCYHFWMAAMSPRGNSSGNQHLHRKTEEYRDMVRRKISAYHCHIQISMIAQGLMQALSVLCHDSVWKHFGSWLRTIRPDILPSELVVALALRHSLPEFLAATPNDHILVNFIRQRLDLDRAEGLRLAA